MLRAAIAMSAAMAAIPAYAQIFKCIDPTGSVEYRQDSCPSETTAALLPKHVAPAPDNANPISGSDAENINAAPPARVQKRRDTVAINSFPGPRSIPPALPVAALPPPPK